MKCRFSFLVLCLIAAFTYPLILQAKDSVRDLPPRYRAWLQDEVNYLITNEEKAAFLQLPTDDDRDKFIESFWALRNPASGAPDDAYKLEIYRRIEYAKQYLDGVHSAMGQIYVTLGEPKQKAKYYGRNDIRPMEIWFYENTNAALPPYFYVVFFDRDNNGTMRLYSPYMDGPSKLATSVLTVNDNKHSFQAIDRALGREVARTTLSLLPDSPVDMQNATASLESDVMLGVIKDLANHPITKRELEQRRLAQDVTHRIVLTDQALDVMTVSLRDAAGNANLHYLLRLHRPGDFAIQRTDDKIFYNIEFSARVYGPDNNLIFKQEKQVSRYLDSSELERIKNSLFGYEGWLPLAPGKYRIEFLLTNKLTKTAYKAEREVVVPAPVEAGLRVSDVLAFSQVEAVGSAKDYLPFTIGGVKFTPTVGDGLTFAPGQSLDIFYQIWGPPVDPASYKATSLDVEYAYGRLGAAGQTKTIHEQVARQQFSASGSLLTGKKVPLADDTSPGNYRLMISAGEPDNPRKVYSSLNFRVSQTPNQPPVFDIFDPDLAEEIAAGLPEFNRALCYTAQNDKDSALKWFKAALARSPGNEIARSRLAGLYFARQDYAEVAALFSRTPVTQDTDEETILRTSESMAKTGDVHRAIGFLENAIALRKSSGPLYIALAGYYRRAGDEQKANQLESKGKALAKE